mmetsp:Transcript_7769/g.12063  ORF Transcript_7769/g.12063 Transcript_7769/m.12063 type:complete len:244 (+) Transcript_7769:1329-2060(+)
MSTPFGHLARTRPYFRPSLRKSTISVTSFLRLARPATSSKETSGTSNRSYLMPTCSSSSSVRLKPGIPTFMLLTPSNAFEMLEAKRYMRYVDKMVREFSKKNLPRPQVASIAVFALIGDKDAILLAADLICNFWVDFREPNTLIMACVMRTISRFDNSPAVVLITSVACSDAPTLADITLYRPKTKVRVTLAAMKRSSLLNTSVIPVLCTRFIAPLTARETIPGACFGDLEKAVENVGRALDM